MRRKGRRPAPSKLAERRATTNIKTTKVSMNHDEIDPEWLDKFLGKIFFWSFTLKKCRPFDHTSKLRVSTHNFVPRHKLIPFVEEVFPEGCNVKLVRGYNFLHTFDLKLSKPMRFDTIIWRVTNALEDVV